METIPLTVVVDEKNPLGKYYISYLYGAGLVPKEIILLRRRVTIKSVLRDIFTFIFRREQLVDSKAISDVENVCNSKFDVNVEQELEYSKYTESLKIIKVGREVINDDSLYKYISESSANTYLFSGGGIVNRRLLTLPNKKMIHTHPGIVPDIRGADCLYWSLILRGRAGYSCFYMSPEIDEGDIIHQEEYMLPSFIDLAALDKYSVDEVYSGVLNSLDQHYRANCMMSALKKLINANFCHENLAIIEQDSEQGRMYFFMHKGLKKYVINKFFKNGA